MKKRKRKVGQVARLHYETESLFGDYVLFEDLCPRCRRYVRTEVKRLDEMTHLIRLAEHSRNCSD